MDKSRVDEIRKAAEASYEGLAATSPGDTNAFVRKPNGRQPRDQGTREFLASARETVIELCEALEAAPSEERIDDLKLQLGSSESQREELLESLEAARNCVDELLDRVDKLEEELGGLKGAEKEFSKLKKENASLKGQITKLKKKLE